MSGLSVMGDCGASRGSIAGGDSDRAACLSLVVFGTGDADIPRSRLLLDAAEVVGYIISDCRVDIWSGLRDKLVAPRRTRARRLFAALRSYPLLVYRYLRLPRHDAVIVLHPGWLDLLVLWPFARLRKTRIVWDAYLPLHEALVEDRGLFPADSIRSHLLTFIEWLACRAANRILCDTMAHVVYMRERYGLTKDRAHRVFVGAEDQYVMSKYNDMNYRSKPFTALFYGQFIPLQGIDVIVDAAKILADAGEEVTFVLVGEGQEAPRIDLRLGVLGLPNLRRVSWIEYGELPAWIGDSDVCLGIFGVSGKAGRVIPNKVFQAIASQRPVVTRDSLAIRELLSANDAVKLIPAGDPHALASSLLEIRDTSPKRLRQDIEHFPTVGVGLVAMHLREAIAGLFDRRVDRPGARGHS